MAPRAVAGIRLTAYFRCAWLPSQNGGVFVCLQAHHATVLACGISTASGANPVSPCEPSQNGWFAERPQEHQ